MVAEHGWQAWLTFNLRTGLDVIERTQEKDWVGLVCRKS
jgi:hypothetical protein